MSVKNFDADRALQVIEEISDLQSKITLLKSEILEKSKDKDFIAFEEHEKKKMYRRAAYRGMKNWEAKQTKNVRSKNGLGTLK